MPKETASSPQNIATPLLGNFDVAIIGGGIAGASLAHELAPHLRVLVLERESQPGYHATGRSAALFSEVYGNDIVRALSRGSRQFFAAPGDGFAEHPLLTPRGTLFYAAADQLGQLQQLRDDIALRSKSAQWYEAHEVRRQLPALRPESAVAGLFESDACDIDVHALHYGYLRAARRHGATVICDAELTAIDRRGEQWTLISRAGPCSAAIIVNAAGAWADDLAALAGAAPLGLTPLRRTAVVFDDRAHWDHKHWPLTIDIGEQLYFKPDAGRLLASPADETPSPPCDAQPDEYDIAVLLDRLERLTLLSPQRITGRWAGLRTFAPDRTPVAGFDPRLRNFFWLAGQGGYGIQTAPAMAALAASLILGHPLPEHLAAQGLRSDDLSPRRFDPPQAITD